MQGRGGGGAESSEAGAGLALQEEATYIQEITTADGQTVQHLVTSDNQVSCACFPASPQALGSEARLYLPLVAGGGRVSCLPG